GSDGGAKHGVHAAGDRREHDLKRHADARQRIWIEVHHELAVERAAERGHGRADDGDGELLARDVDPDRGRRPLVLRDRLERDARSTARTTTAPARGSRNSACRRTEWRTTKASERRSASFPAILR